MNIVLKSLLVIFISFFIVEFLSYVYHRHVAHMGVAGDTIRVPHYCHHNVRYPPGNLESVKYKTANDTWPWLPGIIIGVLFVYFVLYDKYKIIDKEIVIIFFIYALIHIIVTLSFFHSSYHIKNHFLNKYPLYRKIKYRHFMHHYRKCNYGIVFPFMDILFGTEYGGSSKTIKDVFNGFVSSCEDRIKWLDFLG